MAKKRSAKSGGASAVVLKKAMEKKAAKTPSRPVESDEESEESGNFVTFDKKKKADSDDEDDEREVFDLALDRDEDDEDGSEESEGSGSEEGSDDGSDGDSYSEDDSDDDGEENDEERELKELVNNLPAHLRQQVLKKEAAARRRKAGETVEDSDGDDSDLGDSGGEEEEAGWGRKKKTYWEGDTADLEIGQEMEDALEEEEAVQDLFKEKSKRMKASDFMDEFEASGSGSEEDSSDSGDDSSVEKWGAKKGLNGKGGAATVGNLAQVSLGQDDVESDEEAKTKVEKLSKNISHLSKQQRLDMISKNSPELLGIVTELKDQVADLKGRILPLKEFVARVAATHTVQDDVVDYLEVKAQLLLSYCTNVVFYLYMKAQGRSVANHPVMKQLLKLRYVMEKMRPLDGKLKHQIDRLIQLSEMNAKELSQHQSTDLLRPNPSALLAEGDDRGAAGKKKASKKASKHSRDYDEEDESIADEDSEDEDMDLDDDASATDNKAGVYKVPKRTAVPYKESETALEKREQKLEKQRAKIKRSELMDALREEFGSAPEAAASSGLGLQSGDLRKLQEEADERREFEEERFVRLTMSRKDKKSNKRREAEASRLDNFDDIGDIGDFEEMSRLAPAAGGESDRVGDSRGTVSGKSMAGSSSALERAVRALAGGASAAADSGAGSKKSNMRAMAQSMLEDDSDADDPFAAMLAAGPNGGRGGNGEDSRKRRRAPDSRMDDDDMDMDGDVYGGGDDSDDGENLLEDFAQKKKKFLAEKKSHYTAEPRYAGYQEAVEDGAKRAASYEIIKNKGLTPHRKKENRNPRVKKREMFEKAVVRRKGQVREVVSGAAGAYGGELTGIKANLARSRKIGV